MKELISIQTELKAPKNQFNKFGGYKYRSCEDILEALKPLLKKYGCFVTISDDVQQIGERYYIKSTVTITNSEGKKETSTALARESATKKGMDDSQITGSASSYARKYALNGLFAIDDNKDVDSIQPQQKEPKKSTISATRFKAALQAIEKGDYTKEELLSSFSLTEEQKSQL